MTHEQSSGAENGSVAVIGAGISGLSAAWLLSKSADVTLFEVEDRLGGHSNTVDVDGVAVDTGFVVYNDQTYPNLTALLDLLGVESVGTEMSFAASLDDGRLEYAGTDLAGIFAQPSNLTRPRFWRMLRDIVRFYREAPGEAHALAEVCLDDYLQARGYSDAFRNDHLYPMAAAIWSTPAAAVGAYPAKSFIRFCENHGLLKFVGRPRWKTIVGGSRAYVEKLAPRIPEVARGSKVVALRRIAGGVEILTARGERRLFDRAIVATHADQAVSLLADPGPEESRILGAFRYNTNRAALHSDLSFMPKRRRVWSSWNYMARGGGADRTLSVTYWMNRLQNLRTPKPLFVTLNPHKPIDAASVIYETEFTHPAFDTTALAAQNALWSLQGDRRTWFCGAYFGAGFHEDGLQSGLAVAESIGHVRRPWTVANPSGRIAIPQPTFIPALEPA